MIQFDEHIFQMGGSTTKQIIIVEGWAWVIDTTKCFQILMDKKTAPKKFKIDALKKKAMFKMSHLCQIIIFGYSCWFPVG